MFNETFAPVGNYAKTHSVIACLWNESVSGRSANDIISCFHRVIEHHASLHKITFWLDNCASQNKNWGLFLHLLLLVNSPAIQAREIVLKFFESGHTFMAADSFHAAVEKAMRQRPPVTFPEFADAVSKAKKYVDVMNMSATSFFQPTFSVIQYTLNQCKTRPYIDQIRRIIVRKGSLALQYSRSITDDEDIKSCSLFSKKQLEQVTVEGFDLKNLLRFQEKPIGVKSDRKRTLLSVILPLIREEQKLFWKTLPINN